MTYPPFGWKAKFMMIKQRWTMSNIKKTNRQYLYHHYLIFYIWDDKTQIDHVKYDKNQYTVFILPLSVIFYIWDNKAQIDHVKYKKKNNIQ